MDRAQLVLLGLPLFLFCTDLLNFFTPPPPPPHKPPHHHHPHLQHQHQPPPVAKETLEFPSQKPSAFGAIGVGSTVKISFCTSCSYKISSSMSSLSHRNDDGVPPLKELGGYSLAIGFLIIQAREIMTGQGDFGDKWRMRV
ncbi:selT-like protein isoform X2 [Pyrus communis]|uniref:selT-like protein isoform X2 n=1 Tax=Pyrus communis TaxID=23211 RepID=UPI0035C1FBB2